MACGEAPRAALREAEPAGEVAVQIRVAQVDTLAEGGAPGMARAQADEVRVVGPAGDAVEVSEAGFHCKAVAGLDAVEGMVEALLEAVIHARRP